MAARTFKIMKEKRNLLDVRLDVENEGFFYAFKDYSDYEDVDDEKFHRLRKNFLNAAKELGEYLRLEEEYYQMKEENNFKKSIEEVRFLKKAVENNIKLMLNQFETDTGLIISDIKSHRGYFYGGGCKSEVSHVLLEINL